MNVTIPPQFCNTYLQSIAQTIFTHNVMHCIVVVVLAASSNNSQMHLMWSFWSIAIVSKQSVSILAVFSISKQDLYCPINDTTNSALAAGRLIIGTKDNGGCGKHEAELIIKHATGQVVHCRNHSIVDSFKECDDFCKAA